MDRVAQSHQEFLDIKAAMKPARDRWLDSVEEAFSKGVQLQDIAAACGITRSGLYQALAVRRRERHESS